MSSSSELNVGYLETDQVSIGAEVSLLVKEMMSFYFGSPFLFTLFSCEGAL